QIEVNREDALQYGLMPAQIAQTVNMMTRGAFTTQIIAEDGEVLGVYTGFGKAYREDVESLKTIKHRTNAGVFVELQELESVEIKETQTAIRRSHQASAVAVFVKYDTSESLSGISRKVDEAIDEVGIPRSEERRVGK